ncbi:hypothetical protein ACQI4E_31285 [Streptomyces sp. CA-252508]|uniref:hypothetical protein n=1 Tax=Streptomyces sp. CA-252508 TaxID=3418946 RepID=UPI003D8CE344
MSPERPGPVVTGHYDVRRGAAAYAPIVGSFGALSVPATIVLFTTAGSGDTTLVSLAAGLLVVAMIGSLTGSIALAAIGAEVDETANLPAAVMFVAVPVVVSLVSVLSAFATLAAIHLPTQKTLFAVIAGVGGSPARTSRRSPSATAGIPGRKTPRSGRSGRGASGSAHARPPTGSAASSPPSAAFCRWPGSCCACAVSTPSRRRQVCTASS